MMFCSFLVSSHERGLSGHTRRDKTVAYGDKVTFYLFSLTPNEIQKAIDRIDSCIKAEIQTHIFKDEIIKRMDPKQVFSSGF